MVMKRLSLFKFASASIVLAFGLVSSASAHDRFFLGIGGGSFLSPRPALFFHQRNSKAHFSFHIGRPWMLDRWGYSTPYPPAAMVPYQGPPQSGLSGMEARGALHVDGYRVQPSGWLRISVEPSDAEVLVDGFPLMVDRATGTSGSIGFLVGPHRVEVRKFGLQPRQSEVEVKQASESFLQVKLNKD
jgi:hypothetical protein